MKLLVILVLALPVFSFANQLQYVEVLKKGYHITPTVYEAFSEPESAKGLDSEQYLKTILDYTADKAQKNYVLLKEIDFKDSVIGGSSQTYGEEIKEETNTFKFSIQELKACAKRTVPLIKNILFHKSLNQQDMVNNLESILAQEKGLIDKRPAGMICGKYMGEFGHHFTAHYVMDIKILLFISSQSEKEIRRFLRLYEISQSTKEGLVKHLSDFFVTNFLVTSYLRKEVDRINLVGLKEKFKDKFLKNQILVGDRGVPFEVDLSEAKTLIDRSFKETFNELY